MDSNNINTSVPQLQPIEIIKEIETELKDGLNDCTNKIYHDDRKYLSSSVLKILYKSLDEYHDQYILGNKKEYNQQTLANFDVGSLVHSMILEPETVASSYNFYKGWRKSGLEFQEFCSSLLNAKLPIISAPQLHVATELLNAFKALPAALELVKGGFAEQTICGTLFGVPIKTRYDYINVNDGYIADVKTTAYASDKESFSETCHSLSYELSAALYCMMAEQYYGKPFKFYFIVLSKKDKDCNVYLTSEKKMNDGKMKVINACKKYLAAKESNVWTELKLNANLKVVDSNYVIEEI